MTILVEIAHEWNGYEILGIGMGLLLAIVTATMAIFLYKTLNHSIFVASANIIDPYKMRFFGRYRELYIAIMNNAGKELEESTKYEDFVGENNENLLAELLGDLEMLSIMIKNKTIHESMVFEVFGTLILTLQYDPEIIEFIQSRQSPDDGRLAPYGGLRELMLNCYNYKHGINKHSFFRFRN